VNIGRFFDRLERERLWLSQDSSGGVMKVAFRIAQRKVAKRIRRIKRSGHFPAGDHINKTVTKASCVLSQIAD
jgi:hypothetical protein